MAFLLIHGAAPWGISLLSTRHGWIDGRPGRWNVAALTVVIAGVAGIIWGTTLHLTETGETFEMPTSLNPEFAPRYLLLRGPYKYSRNPVYICVLTVWLGWMLFFGSAALLVAWAAAALVVSLVIVPGEERALEVQFGERYLEYKCSVPRWFGRAA
jgi:protein-S-isoprenylcysteine O-methyltransferase Ste14